MKAMKRKMNNPKTNKRRSFRWSSLVLAGIALFCVIHLCGQVKDFFSLQGEIDQYQQELDIAKAEYQEQIDKQSMLGTDAYIERLAREELGMVRRGESVVSVVEGDGVDENHIEVSDSDYDVDANPE